MLPLPDDFYRHRETSKKETTKTLQGELELPGVLMGSNYPPNTVRKRLVTVPDDENPGAMVEERRDVVLPDQQVKTVVRRKCVFVRPTGDPPLVAKYANGCEVYRFLQRCEDVVELHLILLDGSTKLLYRWAEKAKSTWMDVRVCPERKVKTLGAASAGSATPPPIPPGGTCKDYFWVPPKEKEHIHKHSGWQVEPKLFMDRVVYRRRTAVLIDRDRCLVTVTYTSYERRIYSEIDWSAAPPRGKHVRTTEEAIGTPPAKTTQQQIPGCG